MLEEHQMVMGREGEHKATVLIVRHAAGSQVPCKKDKIQLHLHPFPPAPACRVFWPIPLTAALQMLHILKISR